MPKSLSEAFPEICHYTTMAGLRGILESQTLWATHYAHLNDAEEIRHFGERLKEVLKPVVEEALSEFKNVAPAKYEYIEDRGGISKIKQEDPEILVKLIYDTFLGDGHRPPLAEPHIASFCTAVDEREKENGLLSQWRGYGSDGGYAIYFDTTKIEELLRKEAENWQYDYLGAGDVLYSDASDEKIREEIGKHIDDITESIKQFYRVLFSGERDPGKRYEVFGPLLPAMLRCSCLYKHWGFWEEREVRIVAIPQSTTIREFARRNGRSLKPEKIIKKFVRRSIAVPYLELFEGITISSETRLPVTRILVGPHSEKNNRRKDIESLLRQRGINVPVLVSGIPYLG